MCYKSSLLSSILNSLFKDLFKVSLLFICFFFYRSLFKHTSRAASYIDGEENSIYILHFEVDLGEKTLEE